MGEELTRELRERFGKSTQNGAMELVRLMSSIAFRHVISVRLASLEPSSGVFQRTVKIRGRSV